MAEVFFRIEQAAEIGRGQMLGDAGIRAQHIAQVLVLFDGQAAGILHQLVRCRPADSGRQRQGRRLRQDQALCHVEVLAHAHRIYFEAFDGFGHMGERARCKHADLGERFPFRVPVAESALVFLHHRRKHHRHQRRHPGRRRQDHGRRNRIALVRHGRGAAAALCPRFENFADFRLHRQRDVARHLAQGPHQKSERGRHLGNAIPLRMPGQIGQIELEVRGKRRRHIEPAIADCRQRSRGTAELHHQRPRSQLSDAPAMTLDRAQPACGLEAEGDRRRLLQPGAARRRRAPVLAGQLHQGIGQTDQVGFDQIQRAA